MTARRILVTLAVVLLAGVLASCGSGGPGPMGPERTEMVVTLTADGDADVRIRAAAPIASDADLRELAGLMVHAVFRRWLDVRVDGSGHGRPLARAHVDRVYRPGAHPMFRLDATGLPAVLAARGMTAARLRLEAPEVPLRARTDAGAEWSGTAAEWEVGVAGPGPWAEVRLRPRPRLWVFQAVVALVALACLAGALLRPERARTVTRFAGLALLGNTAVVILAVAVHADDAGVAGLASGTMLTACRMLPFVAFLSGVAALVVLVKIVCWRIGADRPPRRRY
jgi:hypothetical protein